MPAERYFRVDVGDVNGLVEALQALERSVTREDKSDDVQNQLSDRNACITTSGLVAQSGSADVARQLTIARHSA